MFLLGHAVEVSACCPWGGVAVYLAREAIAADAWLHDLVRLGRLQEGEIAELMAWPEMAGAGTGASRYSNPFSGHGAINYSADGRII